MKARIIAILVLSLSLGSFAQTTQLLRTVNNKAFKKGERLKFRVHYGIIDAGEAELNVKTDPKKFGSRSVHHIVGTGRSNSAFDLFYKVRDRYDTYLDEEAMVPWLLITNLSEGGYETRQNVIFNHYKYSAKSEKKEIQIPLNVQNVVTTYYYARTLDYSNAKPGDVYTMSAYLDDEVFTFSFKFLGRETITTDLGTFRCLKFCPTLLKGRVFKKEDDMTCWITDDENKIPIRAEAEVIIGSIKMDLMEYEGLANPMAVVKK